VTVLLQSVFYFHPTSNLEGLNCSGEIIWALHAVVYLCVDVALESQGACEEGFSWQITLSTLLRSFKRLHRGRRQYRLRELQICINLKHSTQCSVLYSRARVTLAWNVSSKVPGSDKTPYRPCLHCLLLNYVINLIGASPSTSIKPLFCFSLTLG
jgi:hypothetical protein